MGFLFLAMKTISAPNGAILLFTNPLWVALFGTLFPVSYTHLDVYKRQDKGYRVKDGPFTPAGIMNFIGGNAMIAGLSLIHI